MFALWNRVFSSTTRFFVSHSTLEEQVDKETRSPCPHPTLIQISWKAAAVELIWLIAFERRLKRDESIWGVIEKTCPSDIFEKTLEMMSNGCGYGAVSSEGRISAEFCSFSCKGFKNSKVDFGWEKLRKIVIYHFQSKTQDLVDDFDSAFSRHM